jgi:putative hydrolase of the HAD superfamily
MKHKITDVFFDLDHTLWDFDKNSKTSYQIIFEKRNIALCLDTFLKVYLPLNRQLWEKYQDDRITKEMLRYDRLKGTFDQLGYEISEELVHQIADDYIFYLSKQQLLIEGAIALLDYLRPHYNLHIITNGFQEVQEFKLANSGLDTYFGVVVNSEMAGVKKPNKIIFHYALDQAQVSAEHTIMIGDSLTADVLGALNVGMDAILFNYHKETEVAEGIKVVHSLLEIKSLL